MLGPMPLPFRGGEADEARESGASALALSSGEVCAVLLERGEVGVIGCGMH